MENTISVISWFKSFNNKRLNKYLQLDIKNFCPSIKKTLSHEDTKFAKEHVPITRKDIELIIYARLIISFI